MVSCCWGFGGGSSTNINIHIGPLEALVKGSHSGATKYYFYDEHVEFANERANKQTSGSRGNVTLEHTNVKFRALEGSSKR